MTEWDRKFEEAIRGQLAFLPPDEPLEENADLRDLGLDSMGTVELLSALESAYDVRFVDDALSPETFASAGSLWRTLSALVGAAA